MNPIPHNWKEARRLQAWHLKQQGWPQRQIAEALAPASAPALATITVSEARSGFHPCGDALQSFKNRSRGCLESPCEPFQPQSLRARHAIGGLPGEPTQHQPTHRQVNHGFTAL